MRTSARHLNGNAHAGVVGAAVECPYCGQPVVDRAVLARIATAEQAKIAEVEQALTAKFARERGAIEAAKKADIDRAVKAAVHVAETKLRLVRETQAGAVAAALEQERKKASKKLEEVLSAEETKHFEERRRLQGAISDLRRKVEVRQHPVDIGQPLELALHDAIASAFSENQCTVSRVPRGKAGPDLIVTVIEAGEEIGVIAVEAKAVTRWSGGFVGKAKSDARALSADFAIIATTGAMPKDATGLAVIDGVIICEQSLVVPLLQHLREIIVSMDRLRLTAGMRDDRSAALLEFLGSGRCTALLREFVLASERLQALDERERAAHQTTWARRAELLKASDDAHRQFASTLNAIMHGSGPTDADEEIAA